MNDERGFLSEAVRLATENAAGGQQPFAALVVLDGRVVGSGVNTALRDGDPTAHAEIAAIRDACRELDAFDLPGAAVVCSCEPCPMCHATAVMTGVSRIVYAAPRELAERYGFVMTDVAARMQAAWRAEEPGAIEHIEIEGAEEPFTRFRGEAPA